MIAIISEPSIGSGLITMLLLAHKSLYFSYNKNIKSFTVFVMIKYKMNYIKFK